MGPYRSAVTGLDRHPGCIVKLNRSDIVTRMAKHNHLLSVDDIDLVVLVILEELKDRLVQGDRIELRGFGSFRTTYRKPRLGRNPRTGMRVDVPGKWVPLFKAGKEMRGEVIARFDANALPERPDRSQATQSQSGPGTLASRPALQGVQVQRIASM